MKAEFQIIQDGKVISTSEHKLKGAPEIAHATQTALLIFSKNNPHIDLLNDNITMKWKKTED